MKEQETITSEKPLLKIVQLDGKEIEGRGIYSLITEEDGNKAKGVTAFAGTVDDIMYSASMAILEISAMINRECNLSKQELLTTTANCILEISDRVLGMLRRRISEQEDQ